MKKSKGIAYLLWACLGLVGGHCFYLEKIGKGIFYILTGGGFLIGVIIDLFTLGNQVDLYNATHTPTPINVNIVNNTNTSAS